MATWRDRQTAMPLKKFKRMLRNAVYKGMVSCDLTMQNSVRDADQRSAQETCAERTNSQIRTCPKIVS